jgi:cyclophilin family peptidyl-prolyl cis-trans isomerase
MQRATDAHPFSPMATTRQSQIPTPTTATKQPQKQPELKDDSPATAAIDYRQFLVDFYTKHNPSKLATVEQTLVTYQGRYEEMAAKLTAKYVTKPAAAAVPSPYGLPTGTGPRCFLEFSIGDDNDDNTAKGSSRRVEVQLFADQAPIAVENFRALCTGEMGMCSSNSSSKPLCYRNSQMHRVVPNMCVQGGDFTAGNGTGGESIYRAGCSPHADMWGKFRDEVFLQHDRAGLLSYANNGPNRNGSQFFFTLRPLPHLNGKHVVFGKVIVDNDASDTDGMSVVEEMGRLSTNAKQRPLESAVIQDCGEILPDGTEIRASQLQNGGGTKRLKEQTSTGAAFTTTATNSGTTASPFGFGLSQGSSSGGMFGASQSPFSTNTSQATTSIFGSGKPKESAFGTGSASGGSSVGTTPFSFSPEA